MTALATVTRPHAGALSLVGIDADGGDLREIRRHIGYLPQRFGYYPRYTAREFVEYLAWLKEMPRSAISAAVDRALDRVGLADRADSRMKTLSGGMVRRVGIAQAIVNDPRILLLDEPTAGLDPEQRVSFRRLLRELGSDSCVVVSTHLVEDVAAACEDAILLERGPARVPWDDRRARSGRRRARRRRGGEPGRARLHGAPAGLPGAAHDGPHARPRSAPRPGARPRARRPRPRCSPRPRCRLRRGALPAPRDVAPVSVRAGRGRVARRERAPPPRRRGGHRRRPAGVAAFGRRGRVDHASPASWPSSCSSLR